MVTVISFVLSMLLLRRLFCYLFFLVLQLFGSPAPPPLQTLGPSVTANMFKKTPQPAQAAGKPRQIAAPVCIVPFSVVC
jgi:hypothetical protein